MVTLSLALLVASAVVGVYGSVIRFLCVHRPVLESVRRLGW